MRLRPPEKLIRARDASVRFLSLFGLEKGAAWGALLAAAYITASVASLIRFKSYGLKEFITGFSYPLFFIVFGVSVLLMLLSALLTRKAKHIFRALGLSAVVFASALGAILDSKIWFNMGLAVIIIIIGRVITSDDRIGLKGKLTYRGAYIAVLALAAVFAAAGAYLTYFKYRTFTEATFDLGIFTQMFENMAKTGLPLTTVERGKELTHFAVHFSPFFYLLLPGYLLFRHPVYLFIVQSLGVCLGAFPVFRIAKKLGYTPTASLLFSLVYLCYPTMLNGCFRDFHENKFLAVLVLYLMLFIIERNNVGTAVFAALTLSVKEDAALYVFAAALFIILTREKKLRGVILLIAAGGYFVFASKMITVFGGEPMVSRFANYCLDGGEGMLSVIKTCVFDIGYLILKVFTQDKLVFVMWTCVPLLFGFLSGRAGNCVLLMPAVVINLMSDWIYQYNVDFQYTYGSCAMMIAAVMLAWSERSADEDGMPGGKGDHRRPLISLMLCVVFTFSLMFGKASRYSVEYFLHRESYAEAQKVVDMIPRGAAVSAGDFVVPHLYYIDDLQSFPAIYGRLKKTEYILVDMRHLSAEFDPYVFMDGEYELAESGGFLELWRKTEG